MYFNTEKRGLRHLVCVDADDTLWDTHRLYLKHREQFVDVLRRGGLNTEDAISVLEGIDAVMLKVKGLGPQRYSSSLLATYAYLCGQQNLPVTADMLGAIDVTMSTVTHELPELYEDAVPFLQTVQRFARVVVITSGNRIVQKHRLERYGLDKYVKAVIESPHKTKELYEQVLRSYEARCLTWWMVGDSLAYDVVPAVQAGFRAVHVRRNNWHVFNDVDVPEGLEYHTVSDLTEETVREQVEEPIPT